MESRLLIFKIGVYLYLSLASAASGFRIQSSLHYILFYNCHSWILFSATSHRSSSIFHFFIVAIFQSFDDEFNTVFHQRWSKGTVLFHCNCRFTPSSNQCFNMEKYNNM